ncbi:putative PEP-CTERM system TPR-repeat lipoprotein [Colwellia chukchiensis]|uniref:Putative PEP-CTERM system TPR-repeat lipoprotein n=1 Tax=Colwellia chukchiensis TaxID=641665 RepID=A0A1H7T6A8_9GAMM|nr:XrtA/PEP-CTERM system TPR-repeat protein PrsT [Colwellia chukchiensis]SEL80049.1 putative PEP-CTERM system TPR-repeat lipoprotein [Colwellia chukchiensis]
MKLNLFIASIGLTSIITACGETSTAQDHIVKAKQAIEKSQFSTVEIELKNALKIDANNAEARFLLGKYYLSQGSALEAIKELEKAQALGYLDNKLTPALARAYLLADDNESVLALADTEQLPQELKVEFLAYKTLAAIRAQQINPARQASEQALSLMPGSIFAILSQAYLALYDQDLDKAEALTAKIDAIDDSNPEVVMLAAQVASAQEDFLTASKHYKRYEVLQPNARIVYLLIADSLLKAKKYNEAEKYADIILKLIPGQPLANYVKAMARFVSKDFQIAVELAEKAMQSNFNSAQVRLVAGVSSYYLSNFEKAHRHLSAIEKFLVPEHPAKKMLIVSQFQLGLIDDLTYALDSFSPQSHEDEKFLSALSFNLYSVGATREAKKFAEKSATNPKDSTAIANARHGMLKLLMNDPSGVDDLELALETDPDLKGAEIAIAFAALQSGKLDKALELAEKWQAKHPENAGSYNMLAAVYIAQQQIDLAKQALDTSLSKEQDNLFALTELAKLNFLADNKKRARELAQRAVDKFPDNPKALRYYYAVQADEKALAQIKQAYEKHVDNIDLTLLYIDALIKSDDLMQALAVSNTIDNSVKTPKKAWLQRINIYKQQGNDLQLITTIEKWLQANPYHIEPVLLASDYYVMQRQFEKALQYLDKALLNYHQDDLLLKLVKLQLLLDTANTYEAKKLYQDAQFQDLRPELRSGLAGRIALLEKDYARAVEKLAPFYQAYPMSPNAILLSIAHRGNKQPEQANKVLQQHLENNTQDDRVRMMLANNYLLTAPEKAIDEYEKLMLSQSDNVIIANNLAWLTMENGQYKKALEYAEIAYKLDPSIANVADTFAQVLLKLDNKRGALAKAKEAFEISDGKDIDIALNYIEILILNSRKNAAKQLLANLKPRTSRQQNKMNALLTSL